MKRPALLWLALVGAWANAAGTITSADILAASADLGCLNYGVAGGCMWMRCSPLEGCGTVASVKFRHYIPDAVVTAYPASGRSPWLEMRALGGALALLGDGGTFAKGARSRSATGLRFKLADAVGSPGIAWIEALDLGTTVCDPTATPLLPYYVGGIDPMWRAPGLQTPLALLHLLRTVRHPGPLGSLWGAIYPRTGFVQQTHDYKAGAVVAQRVADIVTRRNQLHIYRPLLDDGDDGQWPPGAVKEGDADTHRWQPLAPRAGACSAFAAAPAAPAGAVDPLGSYVSEGGGYAWNLWRPYECCRKRGRWLLWDW